MAAEPVLQEALGQLPQQAEAEPGLQEALGQLPRQAVEAEVVVALSLKPQQQWMGLERVARSSTPLQKCQ